MTTQCETLEDKLLDLIYGELPEGEAASLRAHAETCESCGKSLAKLTSARRLASALPMEEPRPELTDAIMMKARAMMKAARPAEAVRADAPPPRAARVEARGLWATLVERLGTFLVGPQAAMAAVTVLVVGIGIYYFPRLQSHEPVHGGRTVDPDPTGEAGPSAEIAPAAPLDLRYDPRTRRIVDARDVRPAPSVPQRPAADLPDEEQAQGPAATLDPLQPPSDQPAHERAEGRTDTETVNADGRLAQGQDGDEAGRVVQTQLGEANGDHVAPAGVATLDIAPGQTVRSNGEHTTARHAPAPAAHNSVGDLAAARSGVDDDRAYVEHALHAAGQQWQVVEPSPPAPAEAPETQTNLAPPPPGNADSVYRQAAPPSAPRPPSTPTYVQNVPTGSGTGSGAGVRATGTGSTSGGGGGAGGAYYGRAPTDGTQVAPPSANDGQLAAVALHHRARAEATTAPQAAIRDYVALLAHYPTYADSASAMLELAELYRRTGELGQARVWLSRAETSPAAREPARRMRVQLDEMDRAVRVPQAASNRATETSAGAASSPASE